MKKSDLAVQYKHSGYNCCQAVLAVFADELGIDTESAKKLGAPFGVGMGTMGATCGALIGAQMINGIKEYNGRPILGRARNIYDEFLRMCGGTICAEIKGVTTGRMLCSCDDCVANAVKIIDREQCDD